MNIDGITEQVPTPKRRLKVTSHIARIAIGLVFIISGATKVIDPWATSLKIEEYFTLYGLEILLPASMWLSIWLSSAEMMMGSMMMIKVRIRMVSTFVLLSISFFTISTLLSATIFPIEDCGCFGEVFRLTPWQSFGKNILLLPLALIVFWRYRNDRMFNFNSREIVTAALLFFAIFGTSLYSFLNLPLVDLLPYRKGVNLTEIVLKNQKARKIEYDTVLVYRNIESGETREFTLTDNEWHNESLWEWVETKSIALDNPTNGMSTPFAIVNSKGEDVTLNLITMGRLHIICITKFNAISRTCEQNLEGYIKSANVKKEQVIIITPQELGSVNSPLDSDVELYNIDPLTMRNLLRSKNGVVVINRGIIENKINCRNL